MKQIKSKISIACKPGLIIKAFMDFSFLKEWWQVEQCLIEKKECGVYILAWNVSKQGFGYVSSGIIEKYFPNRRLKIKDMVYLNPERIILGPMTLDLKVEENEGLSILTLIQGGYQTGPDWDWYYEAVKKAWPTVLEDLKSYLEQYSPG